MVNCLDPGLLIPRYSAALETEISWIFFLTTSTGLPGILTFETTTAIPRITFAVSNRDFYRPLLKNAREMASRYKTRRVTRMPRHPTAIYPLVRKKRRRKMGIRCILDSIVDKLDTASFENPASSFLRRRVMVPIATRIRCRVFVETKKNVNREIFEDYSRIVRGLKMAVEWSKS